MLKFREVKGKKGKTVMDGWIGVKKEERKGASRKGRREGQGYTWGLLFFFKSVLHNKDTHKVWDNRIKNKCLPFNQG